MAFLRIALGLLRDAAAISAGSRPEGLIHGDLIPELRELAESQSSTVWPDCIDKMLELIRKIRSNMNTELVLGNYFLALSTGEVEQ